MKNYALAKLVHYNGKLYGYKFLRNVGYSRFQAIKSVIKAIM